MARGWRLWAALWIVYLVWGSTYLAIKVSVRTLPPLLSAGLRFLLAALILAGILVAVGASLRVPVRQALAAGGLGIALLTLGVGVVTLAETRIDSSVAAMIAGSVPLQVIAMRTASRERVASATRISAAVGISGLALIVVPEGVTGGSTAIGLTLMLAATVSWSTGSFVSRRLSLPADAFVTTFYEMLVGGAMLCVLALAVGEGRDVRVDAISAQSIAAWSYLVVFGSLVGFSAYAWLLRNAPISQVVTHQYVNPLVAIALGALLLGEKLTVTTALGALIVLAAVFATVRRESRS
ncbi:EamA-like transporter family [Gaiella occulta]|uniref:EamA-like transporter family n=1 Tax=Gaiella occulta TaxID=1002870 RepID=A0A7M2Z2E7_9ACTN|nr:EamA family transporter [Gaiella occulta]RDI75933.1 EamA-like transporter family [Gaiella occulta]